jgi:hypothetical protein
VLTILWNAGVCRGLRPFKGLGAQARQVIYDSSLA